MNNRMKRFNKWRLLAGLILFFAGLDVALLLSHMSRLVGVFFLVIGGLLIVSSNQEWMESFVGHLPDGVRSLRKKENMYKLHIVLLVILSIITVAIFYTDLYYLAFIFLLLIVSEIVLHKVAVSKNIDPVSLITEFQIFVVSSTAIYAYFGDLFGYRDIPSIFPLLFIVSAWILESIYIKSRVFPKKDQKMSLAPLPKDGKPLAQSLIHFLTLDGRLKKYMPLAGIAAIAGVIGFNMLMHGSLAFGSHDGITILLGVSLLAYNHIPEKYSTERDFTFLFLMFLFLILVLPITLIHYMHGPLTEDTNSPVVYHLLARPTSAMLNLLGIESGAYVTAERVLVGLSVPAETNPDRYIYTRVGIGLSCTGLYSVTTFISAFLAFLMVHFSKFTYKLGAFMALGIATSWVANVIRMTLILVVRYHYGLEAMLWTHHNAGIFIFMAWVALFWGLMFKYFDIPIAGGS